MRRFSSWCLLGFVAFLTPLGATTRSAEQKAGSPGKPVSDIRDEAKLWSEAAVKSASEDLIGIERAYGVSTVIRTVKEIHGEPFREAAVRLAREAGGDGIFIVLTARDERVMTRMSPEARKKMMNTNPSVISQSIAPWSSARGITQSVAEPAIVEARLFDAENRRLLGNERENELSESDRGLLACVRLIEETLSNAKEQEESRAERRIAQAKEVAVIAQREEPASRVPTTLIRRDQIHLTLDGARKIIAAAEAKAAEMKLRVNIAVVDDGGHMIAFERMEGARPASIYTATTKAVTAATMRQPTGPLPVGASEPNVLLNLSLQNAAAASGGKLTTLFGGVPVVVDEQVIGGVGVGGGTGEQDAIVARAGIEALTKEVGSTTPGKP